MAQYTGHITVISGSAVELDQKARLLEKVFREDAQTVTRGDKRYVVIDHQSFHALTLHLSSLAEIQRQSK